MEKFAAYVTSKTISLLYTTVEIRVQTQKD